MASISVERLAPHRLDIITQSPFVRRMLNTPEILRLYEGALAGELAIARASFKHSGQKGSSLERSVHSVLRRFLPENVAVTEGIVIDSCGFVSNQLDIILYDKAHAQLFYNSDSTRVVPAEFVFAVGEVKAQLDKAGYDQFLNSQLAVKNCSRNFMSTGFTYHGYGRDWTAPPIASFLIAFEAPAPSTYNWAVQSHVDMHNNECIDAILSPSAFSIHRVGEHYGPDLLQGRTMSLDCVREHALFIFLGMLAKAAAEWRMRESAVMAKYFMAHLGYPNSLVTKSRSNSVEHKYLKPSPP